MTQLEFELDFTQSEKEISEYILNHGDAILNMSIKELAKKTYTSPATIVRLCQKLNYKGYNDFKIELIFSWFVANMNKLSINLIASSNETLLFGSFFT